MQLQNQVEMTLSFDKAIGSGGDCGELAPTCSVQGTRRLYQFYLIAPLYKWRLSVVRISNFKSVSLERKKLGAK